MAQAEFTLSKRRILYLTKDPSLIERQLSGEELGPFDKEELMNRVSTDTYPPKACFRFDDGYLASKALTGLSLGSDKFVADNQVRAGKFGVVAAGSSFGCGSSREHFPMSLKAAGIELIAAESMERICAQNCQNIGLPYIQGNRLNLLYQLISGGSIPFSSITDHMDQISAEILIRGGLFPFFKQHPDLTTLSKPDTGPRPMTGAEKIIARHMGVPYVKPNDIGFLNIDRRYSYEIFLPFSEHILKKNSPEAQLKNPDSIYLFYDHSVLDPSQEASSLAEQMRKIARAHNLTLYDGNAQEGAVGICHTVILDQHSLPGEVILGTDSHTCTLGAIGALPIGVGATEWAVALITNKVRISVPPSIRFELQGIPPDGVMAKDIMLYLLSLPYIKAGYGIGKIFEFEGYSLSEDRLDFNSRIVLANMSAEGGAYTSYIAPNQNLKRALEVKFGLSNLELSLSDQGAEYNKEFFINTTKLEPYIALPGDPRNGVPLSTLTEDSKSNSKIQKAYIGSCTGGNYLDILTAARILEGRRVNPDVKLFVQASSRKIFQRANEEGLIKIVTEAGGIVVPPGCGACVNFGPGSIDKGETGISSTNRNFPGRMGPGEVFLANPAVVAASAVTGQITNPSTL